MSREAAPFKFNFGSSPASNPSAPESVLDVQVAVQACSERNLIITPASDLTEGHFSNVSIDADRNIVLKKGTLTDHLACAIPEAPERADSDIIPGKYEGGFKLWECALDLAQHLCTAFDIKATQAQWTCALPCGTRVLELGCGHGLPGILMMLAGCEAHFQDYNEEVLQLLTAPNICSNLHSHPGATQSSEKGPRFFAGDWATLPDLLGSQGLLGSYDIILAAETIYSPDSQRQLLQCIKKCLRPGAGQAWIAAKSYYFGVGGGTAAFKALLAMDGTFNSRLAAVIDDGASNKREILVLTHADESPLAEQDNQVTEAWMPVMQELHNCVPSLIVE